MRVLAAALKPLARWHELNMAARGREDGREGEGAVGVLIGDKPGFNVALWFVMLSSC